MRGPEVVDLLAALNTGHEGGCGTVHANAAAQVPARLEALGTAAGLDRAALHSQLAAALSVVLHLVRDRAGRRRIAEVHVLERDAVGAGGDRAGAAVGRGGVRVRAGLGAAAGGCCGARAAGRRGAGPVRGRGVAGCERVRPGAVGWRPVACAGAAAWVLGGRDAGVRRARLLLARRRGRRDRPPLASGRAVARLRGRLRAEWWSPVAGLVVAVLGASVLPLVAGAAAVPLLRRVRRAAEARRARERRGDAVVALCGALAGEVRAGRQPGEALLRRRAGLRRAG